MLGTATHEWRIWGQLNERKQSSQVPDYFGKSYPTVWAGKTSFIKRFCAFLWAPIGNKNRRQGIEYGGKRETTDLSEMRWSSCCDPMASWAGKSHWANSGRGSLPRAKEYHVPPILFNVFINQIDVKESFSSQKNWC